jgi:peptidyl-tRNA hydrolase
LAEASETGLAGVSGRGPFLIVGLGNPGLEYVWTPHNAGFMAIDRIAQQEGVVVQNRRCRATTATCRIAGRQVVLAKPETFMNLSGALQWPLWLRSLKPTRRGICS